MTKNPIYARKLLDLINGGRIKYCALASGNLPYKEYYSIKYKTFFNVIISCGPLG